MLDLLELLSRREMAGLEGVAVVDLPLTRPALDRGFAIVSLSSSVAGAFMVTGLGVGSFEKRGMPVALTGLVGGSILMVPLVVERIYAHHLQDGRALCQGRCRRECFTMTRVGSP